MRAEMKCAKIPEERESSNIHKITENQRLSGEAFAFIMSKSHTFVTLLSIQ